MNRPAGCSCPSNRNPGDDDGTKCRSQVAVAGWLAVRPPPGTLTHTPPKCWCRPAVFGSKWRVVGLIGTVQYPPPR